MITNKIYKEIYNIYQENIGKDDSLKEQTLYLFIYKGVFTSHLQGKISQEKQEKLFDMYCRNAKAELLRLTNEKEFEYPPMVIVKYPDLLLPIWQTLTYDN